MFDTPGLCHMCPKDFVSNRNINDMFEEVPLISINRNLSRRMRDNGFQIG